MLPTPINFLQNNRHVFSRSLKPTVAASWITVINRTTTSPNRNLNNIFSFSCVPLTCQVWNRLNIPWKVGYLIFSLYTIKTAKILKVMFVSGSCWPLAWKTGLVKPVSLWLFLQTTGQFVYIPPRNCITLFFVNKDLDFYFLVLFWSYQTKQKLASFKVLCLYCGRRYLAA